MTPRDPIRTQDDRERPSDEPPKAPEGSATPPSRLGLDRPPFAPEPDPDFYQGTSENRRALKFVQLSLAQLSPVTLLLGERGAGKTTLIRRLAGTVSQGLQVGILTGAPDGGAGEPFARFLAAFGRPAPVGDPDDARGRFLRFVVEGYDAGRASLLIVDDAHLAPDDELWTLQMLLTVGPADSCPLILLLAGEAALRGRLREPALQPLAQRVEATTTLGRLSRAETAGYVRHRLAVAGGSTRLFDDPALEEIHASTGGLPGAINALCERCLTAAAAKGAPRLDAALVRAVAEGAPSEPLPHEAPGDVPADEAPAAQAERDDALTAAAEEADPLPLATEGDALAAAAEEGAPGDALAAPSEPELPAAPPLGLAVLGPEVGPSPVGAEWEPDADAGRGTEPETDDPDRDPEPLPPPDSSLSRPYYFDRPEFQELEFEFDAPSGASQPEVSQPEPSRSELRPSDPGPPEPSPEPVVPAGSEDGGAIAEPARAAPEAADPAPLPLLLTGGIVGPQPDLPEPDPPPGPPVPAPVAAPEPTARDRRPTGGEPGSRSTPPDPVTPAVPGDSDPPPIRPEPAPAAGPPEPTPAPAAEPTPPGGHVPEIRSVPPTRRGARLGVRALDGLLNGALVAGAVALVVLSFGTAGEPPSTAAVAPALRPAGAAAPPASASADDLFREALRVAPDDPAAAAVAYARAAIRGHDRAAYYLGQLYETGDGVPLDRALARAWYRVAADGVEGAHVRLADLSAPGGTEMVGKAGLAAPTPLYSGRTTGGEAELVWTGPKGAEAFVVEIARDPERGADRSEGVAASAVRLPLGEDAAYWRVVAQDGAEEGAGDEAEADAGEATGSAAPTATPWLPIDAGRWEGG